MHPVARKLRSLAISSILGGGILFGWSYVSWMHLSWHDNPPAMRTFVDQQEVMDVLQRNAPVTGVYVAPLVQRPIEGETPEYLQRKMEIMAQSMRGPAVFVAMRYDAREMGAMLGWQYAIFVAGALFASIATKSLREFAYWRRVLMSTVVGLAIGIVGHLPAWNWWGVSLEFTLVEIADLVIGFTLAGLVIAYTAKWRGPIWQ